MHQNRLYNSGLYATLGGPDAGIRHVHRKVFLPTYGVFDEERFVEAGRSVQAFDTRWGRAAILICEDAWHSFTPMLAALGGAQLIIIPSASPARGVMTTDDTAGRPTSLARWGRIVQDIAGEHGVFVALAQLVGFEGGKAFPGGSVVASPRGDILADGPIFEEALIPRRSTSRRSPGPVPICRCSPIWKCAFRTCSARCTPPGARKVATATAAPRVERGASHPRGRSPPPCGISPDRGRPARDRRDLTRRWLVEFIRDEVRRRRGFEQVVIGLSGGVDSSLVAFLAAEALGPENVLGIRMPYRTSSAESLSHAALVADALGIELVTVDISAAVDGLAAAIGGGVEPGRLGNIMARTRMITLFDLSAPRSARCRSAPATRPSACSATSPGTPTTRRRSIRSAISSRPRSGRSPATSACRT